MPVVSFFMLEPLCQKIETMMYVVILARPGDLVQHRAARNDRPSPSQGLAGHDGTGLLI
jgi:hypothetical protein